MMDFLVYIFAVFMVAINLFWSRREIEIRMIYIDEDDGIKLPSLFSFLIFGRKTAVSTSLLGLLFISVIYIPVFLASFAVTLMAAAGIVTSFLSLEISWLQPFTVIIAALATVFFYFFGLLFFTVLDKVLSIMTSDISLLIEMISMMPKYVWIFILGCVPIPFVVRGGILSVLVCLAGMISCIAFMFNIKVKVKAALIIFVLAGIVAATWVIADLVRHLQFVFTSQ